MNPAIFSTTSPSNTGGGKTLTCGVKTGDLIIGYDFCENPGGITPRLKTANDRLPIRIGVVIGYDTNTGNAIVHYLNGTETQGRPVAKNDFFDINVIEQYKITINGSVPSNLSGYAAIPGHYHLYTCKDLAEHKLGSLAEFEETMSKSLSDLYATQGRDIKNSSSLDRALIGELVQLVETISFWLFHYRKENRIASLNNAASLFVSFEKRLIEFKQKYKTSETTPVNNATKDKDMEIQIKTLALDETTKKDLIDHLRNSLIAQGFLEKAAPTGFKKEVIDAAYRVAYTQLLSVSRGIILNFLEKSSPDNKQLQALTSLLDTEFGKAFISMIIGAALTYTPQIKDNKNVEKLAREFRVGSITIAGNSMFEGLMEMIVPVISSSLQTISEATAVEADLSMAAPDIEPLPELATPDDEPCIENITARHLS